MKTIAFIGLGIMGRPMAKNLLKAGYSLRVFDINQAAVEEVAGCGGTACASIEEAVKGCGVIITMLPNSPQVEEVALGKGGLSEHAEKGSLLVDMSSIAPLASIHIGEELARFGIRMLDAPVSGGEPKAIDGTLAIMVGGEEKDFEEAKPLFDVLGASAVLVGRIGAGNTTKLANQVIVALNIAALSEALMLAKKAGVDPKRVVNAIQGGLAGSTVMNAKAPMMLDRNFKPGFMIDLHVKDLRNVLETARKVDSPSILTDEVFKMFLSVQESGEGRSDHSALVKYYEKIAGTEVGEG